MFLKQFPLPNVTRHSGWWQHTVTPSIDRTLHQFLTITDLVLITELVFLPNCVRFPKNICNGCGMPTDDAYSLRTPGPVPFGICICSSNRNHTTYLWRFPNMTYLPNFTLLNWRGFNRIYATGVACKQGTLTPPDTWSCPTLGLACVLMSRPISPKLILSPDFWISNIPRYFSFALYRNENLRYIRKSMRLNISYFYQKCVIKKTSCYPVVKLKVWSQNKKDSTLFCLMLSKQPGMDSIQLIRINIVPKHRNVLVLKLHWNLSVMKKGNSKN